MKFKLPKLTLFRSCLACGTSRLLDWTWRDMLHFMPTADRIIVYRTDDRWHPGVRRDILAQHFAIKCSTCQSNRLNYHIDYCPPYHWSPKMYD